MLANNTGIKVGQLVGRFPGALGHLYSPGAQVGPYEFMPYALDNGAYVAYKNGTTWDEAGWVSLLGWAAKADVKPLWALVPDCVADRDETLRRWEKFYPAVKEFNFLPAFAVQDGMSVDDVPKEAAIVFVGGSTDWKWATLENWGKNFPRVHVGRVNTYGKLVEAWKCGAESCDGTGWLRGNKKQWAGLVDFLEGKHIYESFYKRFV